MAASDFPTSALVSVLALMFTVASFWWLWLRRGRLTASPPRFFAAAVANETVLLRLPLVCHNAGARTIVVEDLRLFVDGQTLDWFTTRNSVNPEAEDLVDFAAPFAVAGREARPVIVEFRADNPWRPEVGRPYGVRIERLTRERWKDLVAFTWWAPPQSIGPYIAGRNRRQP